LEQLIQSYAQGADQLHRAVDDLTPQELMAVPIPGRWPTHTVVLHLADADAAFADRMRRIIAEDDPALPAWDENRFAEHLFYAEQSAQDALALIELTRRQMTRILHQLPDAAFDRPGQHSVRGRQTLRDVVQAAIGHLDHHLNFIHQKRAKLGKPIR
jgi:uncharacterized damage-inducible protein DinB